MSKKSRLKKQKFFEKSIQNMAHMSETHEPSKKSENGIKRFYFENIEKLMLLPMILLIISIGVIGFKLYQTGDFVNKGVSLKGGISVTLMTGQKISVAEFQDFLSKEFKGADYSVIAYSSSGVQQGLILEITDIEVDTLTQKIRAEYGLSNNDFTVEQTGSVIGASFFSQTIKAMIIAFLLMGMVVFLYFGDSLKSKFIVSALTIMNVLLIFSKSGIFSTVLPIIVGVVLFYFYLTRSIPSFAVILAGFSTIIMTLAVFNLMDMKLTTGGIAAFLMLIGYSVDTDILLTTRVIKNKDNSSFEENIISSIKTGLTMTFSAIAAVGVAFFVSQSEMLKQIMLILLIGLIFDLINTWIQNVGVLKLYLKHKQKKTGTVQV